MCSLSNNGSNDPRKVNEILKDPIENRIPRCNNKTINIYFTNLFF